MHVHALELFVVGFIRTSVEIDRVDAAAGTAHCGVRQELELRVPKLLVDFAANANDVANRRIERRRPRVAVAHEEAIGRAWVPVTETILDEEAAQLVAGLKIDCDDSLRHNPFSAIERTVGAIPLDVVDRRVRVATRTEIIGGGGNRKERYEHDARNQHPKQASHTLPLSLCSSRI